MKALALVAVVATANCGTNAPPFHPHDQSPVAVVPDLSMPPPVSSCPGGPLTDARALADVGDARCEGRDTIGAGRRCLPSRSWTIEWDAIHHDNHGFIYYTPAPNQPEPPLYILREWPDSPFEKYGWIIHDVLLIKYATKICDVSLCNWVTVFKDEDIRTDPSSWRMCAPPP
jgi:hypothetical protein